MARKNMIDDGSYQEKQKLKTRKNFFDFTQQELDEARDKEQEQSRKVAERNAKYGMNMMGPSKKPKQKESKATSKPKLLKNKYDNPSKFGSPEYYKEMEEMYIESGMREEDYPIERKERQTLESILPKPLGEE